MDINDIENDQNLLNITNPITEIEPINNDDLLNKLNNDDEDGDENDDFLLKNTTNIHKKRIAIIDSDDEEPPTPHNKSFDEHLSTIIPKDVVENSLKLYSKLCDSESSTDEENERETESPIIPNKSKSNFKRVDEKPKKMTAKEALQQRREIWSESQRMTREMNVSLPYHRPKTRSIKEFLEQRPKFSSSVPNGSVCVKPAIALKMNMQQLELISKNLEEREKQIEEYFKSDDEEQDDVEETKNEEEIIKDDDENKSDDQKNENNENQIVINDDEKNIDEIGSENVVILQNLLIQPSTSGDVEGSLMQSKEEINENIIEAEIKPKKVLDIIREKYGNFKPSLTKSKDFINLDENVNELKERFIKHTAKKQPHKHNVHLDIVNVTNGELHKEKLEITIEDDTIPIIEKPGERLKKLKDELEMKIAEEQTKFWKQRLDKKPETDEDDNIKKIDDEDDDEYDVLDKIDNDEEEFTEIEDDEDGDEIIGDDDEDNEEFEEKSEKKSKFLENEAEESDCGEDDEEMDVDNGEENCEDDVNDEGDENDENQDENDEENENNLDADDEDECNKDGDNKKKKKVLRRIIQAFENDSDEETESVSENVATKSDLHTTISMDTTETMDDFSAPTPHQKQTDYTPVKPYMTQSKPDLGFLTPVYHLTGLQSLNSKFLHDSPVSPFVLSEASPSRMSQSGPQKKLFADDNVLESQSTLDDLEHLCSGKFTTQTQNLSTTNDTKIITTEIYTDSKNSTQELLDICSGKFTGITQLEPSVIDKDENHDNTKNNDENRNFDKDKESKIYPKCTTYTSIKTSNDEIKNFNDKDDEKLILGLLEEDEEELESFKKKFESPQKLIRGKIIDSDDEEENQTTKKKKVRNCIQDDEDDENIHELNSENGDSEEDLDNQDSNNVDDVEEIEYDSEENEIVVKKQKITDFFEEEAELSESEWGSADEDEKGIDDLEFEEGDNDLLDERKLKRDLERIHMRRILDDDNHEVKILQEILLDDGELHGKGRERQFKWRNINNDEDETKKNEDDGEIYFDDDNENEEEWRKKRFEREIFLKKQQDSLKIEETTLKIQSTSQIFKLGQAAIKRSLNTPNNSNNTTNEKANSPDFKSSFTLTNKKGSFLTRSEQVLARVAEFTSKTVNPTIGGAKKSRNFVFHTIESTEIEIEGQNVKKRKAEDGKLGTPIALKRLRVNNVSPAVKKKSEKTDRVKKLFTNW